MDLSKVDFADRVYKIEMSPNAQQMLNAYATYIEVELDNPKAADNLLIDADNTLNELSKVADTLNFLSKPALRKRGYRKILFLKYHYIMIYKIVSDTIRIEAVYHQKQDYENLFAEEIQKSE